VVAIPFIVVIIPLATIVWAAFLPYYQPFSIAALPKLGVGNFVEVLNSPSFRESIPNTLVLGACAATLVTVLSVIAGWCVRVTSKAAICWIRWRHCHLCFPRLCSASPSSKFSSILAVQSPPPHISSSSYSLSIK